MEQTEKEMLIEIKSELKELKKITTLLEDIKTLFSTRSPNEMYRTQSADGILSLPPDHQIILDNMFGKNDQKTGNLTTSDIENILGKSQARTNSILSDMEKDGYIVRARGGRSFVWRITQKGSETLKQFKAYNEPYQK
jgi:DNA-binding MarR family transcriptional regulator